MLAASGEMAEPWVSVDDVVRHLGVAKDTIYRWIDTRGLPAHRVGRLWKFKIDEVDEWVRRGGAGEREPRGEVQRTAKASRRTARRAQS